MFSLWAAPCSRRGWFTKIVFPARKPDVQKCGDTMTRLLVSVRNAAEAVAALQGGAHLIDVKEPSRGPLGRADDATIAEVVKAVAGRRRVSAALGELHSFSGLPACLAALQFVKWGLSTFRAEPEAAWAKLEVVSRGMESGPAVVTVAYADARQASAPDVEMICAQLVAARQGVLLLDTFEKNGRTLLDHLNEGTIEQIVQRCRSAGVRVALAGSLGVTEIRVLKHLRPDWFAVRGAACQGRERHAAIYADHVQQLVELLGDEG
jgi:(5-formylfuran-3-yl)methyl phosphate synthase